MLLAVKNNLKFVPYIDGQFFNIEATSVKVSFGTKKIIICTIYRPPSANDGYFRNVIRYMEKVMASAYDTVFVGDFNYDVLKSGPDLNKINYICNLFNMNQLVEEPTRTTFNSASCIDLVFSNMPHRHKLTRVLPLALSDHYLVHTVLDFKLSVAGNHTIKCRSYKHLNKVNFLRAITNSDRLMQVFNHKSVITAWHVFKTEFINICETYAPIKHICVKNRNNPWMSNDIQQLIYTRDSLHEKAVKTCDAALWHQYREARNLVTSTIRRRKKNYLSKEIISNRFNKR